MSVTEFTMANVPRFVGREMGTPDWIDVGQDRIDNCAACPGEISGSTLTSSARDEKALSATITHGYLSLSLVAPIVARIGLVPATRRRRARPGNARLPVTCTCRRPPNTQRSPLIPVSAARAAGAQAAATHRAAADQ